MLSVDLAKVSDEEGIFFARAAQLRVDALDATAESITDHLLGANHAMTEIFMVAIMALLQDLMVTTIKIDGSRGDVLDGDRCHYHILDSRMEVKSRVGHVVQKSGMSCDGVARVSGCSFLSYSHAKRERLVVKVVSSA